MGFQQGLSGLYSSSQSLDVISHNIANASTVGFKAGTAIFGDVYASAMMLGGGSSNQIGIGSRVSAVWQQFTQGNFSPTENALDMAINGNGFFRMVRTDGTIAYTRNGQFDANREGFIINASGDKLTGYAAVSEINGKTVFAGEPSVMQIDTSGMAPRETTEASLSVNLDSKEVNPLDQDPPGQDITTFLSDVTIPQDSYNWSTSFHVYDSLGNQSLMELYFVREPDVGGVSPNQWRVYGRMSNDIKPDPTAPGTSLGLPLEDLGTLDFTPFGTLDPLGNSTFTITRTAADLGTGADDMQFTIDLAKSSQWNEKFSQTNNPVQDGYTTGRITGMTVSEEGVLQGTYSNGLTRDIGKIALAHFRSPNGLIALGDNMYAESYDSGQPMVGAPRTGVFGAVLSKRVEDSNVDLTQELVDMIIQQRNYQANAQTIRTQDQILQTLVNLR